MAAGLKNVLFEGHFGSHAWAHISCSSKLVVATVWPVRIKKLYITWVGCLADKMGSCMCRMDFLYYNLQLPFIPFYVNFICIR